MLLLIIRFFYYFSSVFFDWRGCQIHAIKHFHFTQTILFYPFSRFFFSFPSNVINATGIKPHPLLSHVRVILEQDPASLNKAIELLPRKCLSLVAFLFCLYMILFTAHV